MSSCGEYGPYNSSCSSMVWEFHSSSCVPDIYVGSVCVTHLRAFQGCAAGSSDNIFINKSHDQAESEELAITTLELISQFSLNMYKYKYRDRVVK